MFDGDWTARSRVVTCRKGRNSKQQGKWKQSGSAAGAGLELQIGWLLTILLTLHDTNTSDYSGAETLISQHHRLADHHALQRSSSLNIANSN